MQRQSADEILARIDGHRRARLGGCVAFDGDGTLWSGDVGEDFFHAFLDHGDFREPARVELEREAATHAIDASGDGKVIARRLYDAYVAGHFPEERICALMAWCCAGWSKADVDEFAARVIETHDLGARMHREVVRVSKWAEREGIEVFVVSASPRAIVEAATCTIGVPADHVLAATPDVDPLDGSTLLPSVALPIPYGDGKVTHLRGAIGNRAFYAAFGDNSFDVPMLREASVPVAVRPKMRLRDRAADVPLLVEITPEE